MFSPIQPTTTMTPYGRSSPPPPYCQSHGAWLCVAYPDKSESFKARYCVLRSTWLCIYRDRQQQMLLHRHRIVRVEVLHFINQGLCVVDDQNHAIWLHTTSNGGLAGSSDAFETWLFRFRSALNPNALPFQLPLVQLFDRRPADNHRFDLPESSGDQVMAGWFNVRRVHIRNFLYGRMKSMFVVLRGNVLTGFRANVEGRQADLYGRVKAYRTDLNALEILLENGHLVQLHPRNGRHIDRDWLVSLHQSCRSPFGSEASVSSSRSSAPTIASSGSSSSCNSHSRLEAQTRSRSRAPTSGPPCLCCLGSVLMVSSAKTPKAMETEL